MKKIKTIHTYLINDETTDEGILSVKEERDQQGNVTLLEQYFMDGTIEQRSEHSYNDKGKLIEEKQFSSLTAKPDQHVKYTYNESGKLAQKAVHYLDGSISFWNFSYDEKENSQTINIIDDEDETEGKEYRRRDSEGRLLEEAIFGEDEALERKIQIRYDDHGRVIEQTVVQQDGHTFTHFYDYEFDEEGRVKSVEIYDKDEEVVRYDEVTYDEAGNQKEMKMENYQAGWSVVNRWEYDEKGNITKEQQLQPDGFLLEENEYRRDENNLIVEKESRSGKGVSMLKYVYGFFD